MTLNRLYGADVQTLLKEKTLKTIPLSLHTYYFMVNQAPFYQLNKKMKNFKNIECSNDVPLSLHQKFSDEVTVKHHLATAKCHFSILYF